MPTDKDTTGSQKIHVTPEGRPGVWIADKESLKAFIRWKGWKAIHNFKPMGGLMLGADHDVESVLEDIDRAERVAVLTDGAERTNLGHALALIIQNRLECFDIGTITGGDLLPQRRCSCGKALIPDDDDAGLTCPVHGRKTGD